MSKADQCSARAGAVETLLKDKILIEHEVRWYLRPDSSGSLLNVDQKLIRADRSGQRAMAELVVT
jgi:hypothetical protein